MEIVQTTEEKPQSAGSRIVTFVLRLLLAVAIPLIAFATLYYGFLFLRDSNAPKWVITSVAIVWGVGGVAVLFWIFNWLVEMLPIDWKTRLLPYVFVGPGVAILTWYLALPAVRTFWISLFDRNGPMGFDLWFNPEIGLFASLPLLFSNFVGLDNYLAVFNNRLMLEAFRNNILFWMLIGTPLTVGFGLLIAVLADRSRFEKFFKSLIFMPMAISFVGASVIWRFVYEVRPTGSNQIGLLNAIIEGLGGTPQYWPAFTQIAPFNNLFLVVIVIWLQAGFSMVLISAALKGIPEELLEAARVDGANEFQVFFRIMIPQISGTLMTVTTTVLIFTLKIFDVVWVMTGGQFGTEVIATQFVRQSFVARNAGFGSAIAIILLIAVIPMMIYNLRRFRESEGFA
jgi:alpha-glucoside transport system permease protein